jgi:deoxyribodipyrimidine photo-lyase
MEKPLASALIWFRRDLRAGDHAALYHALKAARRVWCAFVLDREILDPLLARGLAADRRVEFILDSLHDLRAQLARLGGPGAGLIVRHAAADEAIPRLARELHVQAVYANHDDDPQALARDTRVRGALAHAGIALHTSKDHVIFERDEILTGSGLPYRVFTPYKAAWLRALDAYQLEAYRVAKHAGALAQVPEGVETGIPALSTLGFRPTNLHALKLPTGTAGAQSLLADFLGRIDAYAHARDFPAVKGPSYLSAHLRFGTISVRQLAREAWMRMQSGSRGAETWLSELVWRDFFHQVLHHHPHVVGHAYHPAYDHLRWEHGREADAHFAAWCEGATGYPLVDAAMKQLAQTGYMHNRLRMLTASFLVKDLGIDWRRGERWFADLLLDYDLAANNGGWQWAAGTGCDAAPWFRIFNPVTQSRRYDPHGRFIRRYLPQLAGLPDAVIHAPWEAAGRDLAAAKLELGKDYPLPIVDHEEARQRALARYAAVKKVD